MEAIRLGSLIKLGSMLRGRSASRVFCAGDCTLRVAQPCQPITALKATIQARLRNSSAASLVLKPHTAHTWRRRENGTFANPELTVQSRCRTEWAEIETKSHPSAIATGMMTLWLPRVELAI